MLKLNFLNSRFIFLLFIDFPILFFINCFSLYIIGFIVANRSLRGVYFFQEFIFTNLSLIYITGVFL